MFSHILIPTDGSPLSAEAVKYGVDLAAKTGAQVSLITVTEPFHTFSYKADQLEDTPDTYRLHMDKQAARYLDEAAAAAAAAEILYDKVHVEDDQPYEAIIRTAEQKGCDLIVMASHGRRGVSALVLGSETMKVLTHTNVPVLVVRSSGSRPKEEGRRHREDAPQTLAEQLP